MRTDVWLRTVLALVLLIFAGLTLTLVTPSAEASISSCPPTNEIGCSLSGCFCGLNRCCCLYSGGPCLDRTAIGPCFPVG